MCALWMSGLVGFCVSPFASACNLQAPMILPPFQRVGMRELVCRHMKRRALITARAALALQRTQEVDFAHRQQMNYPHMKRRVATQPKAAIIVKSLQEARMQQCDQFHCLRMKKRVAFKLNAQMKVNKAEEASMLKREQVGKPVEVHQG